MTQHTSTLSPPPIAVAVSRYNASVTQRLLDGAVRAYSRSGGRVPDLHIAEAPGAFELVALCANAARTGHFAGVVALGCIIKGETRHDQVLADAVTSGLANIALITGVPIGLGVLTVDTPAQAAARAGGRLGNKGEEAMDAVLASIAEIALLSDPRARRRAAESGLMARRVMASGLAGLPDKAAAVRTPRRPARKGRA